MPFELRSPAGLWLLGLVAPLVVLYILKIRRERLRVASTWLWAAAARDLLAKSPFRRLLVQVPLLLQLAALVLIALAASRPATRGAGIVGDHVALIVDVSASMGCKNADSTTRMQAAKKAARDVIRALGPGADAMVIEAAREARIASPLDRDARRLESAVDRLEVNEVEGNLGRALAIASDRLRQLPGEKRIVVVTDRAVSDPAALANVALPVDVVDVGSDVDNTAIVRVDARNGVDPATKREQVQVFALVAHHGKAPRDVFVTLRQRNVKEPLASRKLTLAPGERAPVVLTFEPARGDLGSGLIVELSPEDALASDDRAFARVPAGRRIPVVLAPSDGSPWVKRALQADPDVELVGTTVAGLASASIPDDALVVVDGACPANLPGADLVVLNPPPGRCRTAVVGDPIDHPAITSWSEADPRLRFLTLDGVEIQKARKIETEGPGDSLVRTQNATLISDVSSPGRSGTLVGFDVGDSNWPLKASFVLFVRNVVELARTHRARGVTGPARTGEPMTVRVPPDVTAVEVEDPAERKLEVGAKNGLVIVPEVSRAGFYFVSWQGKRPGSVLIAANLTSDVESDLAPKKLESAGAPVTVSNAKALADAHTEWGWLVAALAFAFIALDAWWLTRRPRTVAPSAPRAPKLPERPRARSAS
jgi:von Willebrand factor type A domain/Aerotolerance regulator N-terminal